MIIQVVFGAVLIVLGLCALIGLPALSLHLQGRDERAHVFEKAFVADVHKLERTITHIYENEITLHQPARAERESNVAYH
ncbi:MAG TPA: hypothetical protein VG246_07415 [Acidimicrobiales bacterium]|jgi:hypothetical protein|nr:hypothetical protein [Acidimicrobiales bacterium]